MATLHLIRHGQASFRAEDYDVLSELGVTQARLLGAHFAESGQRLDAVYVGPRRRQRDTAGHLLDAARAAGADYPDPVVVDELDEFPAFDIVKHAAPRLLAEDPVARSLSDGGERGLGRLFEHIVGRWLRGDLDAGPFETFAAFEARVRRGLDRIIAAQGRGRETAVVTSGGPISIAVKASLALADETLLRVQSVIANASIHQFKYRPNEITMTGFNLLPHLRSKDLVTMR